MGTKEAVAKNRAKRVGKGGRPKGSKNKFTNLKDSFLKAYESEDGFGGDEELKKFAKENPGKFLDMITKLFPKDIKVGGDEDNPLTLSTTWFPPSPKDLKEWEAQFRSARK